jgi:hypothetical protein
LRRTIKLLALLLLVGTLAFMLSFAFERSHRLCRQSRCTGPPGDRKTTRESI